MNTVPLSVARRLKELGFPQDDKWPMYAVTGDLGYIDFATNDDYFAAPDVLTALEFLRSEFGWWFDATTFGDETTEWGAGMWETWPTTLIHAYTASALVEAILQAIGGQP